jgi:hypothetical protein
MAINVPVEAVGRDLQSLLEGLNLGETVTLVDAEGVPQALLVSLQPLLHSSQAEADWEARWDTLARQVSKAWKSEKSAVELLADMR